ncbi:MAG TPA: hypothetical protein DIV86_02275 [Alphaproteobacteria bacterium]|nr:hypothetical protein [Alphaproteobacteria bacterium]
MLSFWLEEIERIYSTNVDIYPHNSDCRELGIFLNNHDISADYLIEMINGQKMDLNNEMVFPTIEKLDLYCYRVASCVGIISAKIFGYNKNNEEKITNFATNLGKYFQYINILRDFEEDFINGRIYIPLELFHKFGVDHLEIEFKKNNLVKIKQNLKPIFYELSNMAKSHYQAAFDNLPDEEMENMRPALLMEKIYSKYLYIMEAKKFEFQRRDISLSLWQKFQIFFRL